MPKKVTTEDYIKSANKKHGDRYDYSICLFTRSKDKVKIICRTHGIFEKRADSHLSGQGCPKCGKIKQSTTKITNMLLSKFKNLEQPSDYKLIPIRKNIYAKLDNEDFDKLKSINWRYAFGYASSNSVGLMHRFIVNCPDTLDVDHINHDKLDNRKQNLRICTRQQNSFNTPPRVGKSSLYKGVYARGDKWRASITISSKKINLGTFASEIEAAKAYDEAAKIHYGEFAYLNFIDNG